jgi:hypothetical protein
VSPYKGSVALPACGDFEAIAEGHKAEGYWVVSGGEDNTIGGGVPSAVFVEVTTNVRAGDVTLEGGTSSSPAVIRGGNSGPSQAWLTVPKECLTCKSLTQHSLYEDNTAVCLRCHPELNPAVLNHNVELRDLLLTDKINNAAEAAGLDPATGERYTLDQIIERNQGVDRHLTSEQSSSTGGNPQIGVDQNVTFIAAHSQHSHTRELDTGVALLKQEAGMAVLKQRECRYVTLTGGIKAPVPQECPVPAHLIEYTSVDARDGWRITLVNGAVVGEQPGPQCPGVKHSDWYHTYAPGWYVFHPAGKRTTRTVDMARNGNTVLHCEESYTPAPDLSTYLEPEDRGRNELVISCPSTSSYYPEPSTLAVAWSRYGNMLKDSGTCHACLGLTQLHHPNGFEYPCTECNTKPEIENGVVYVPIRHGIQYGVTGVFWRYHGKDMVVEAYRQGNGGLDQWVKLRKPQAHERAKMRDWGTQGIGLKAWDDDAEVRAMVPAGDVIKSTRYALVRWIMHPGMVAKLIVTAVLPLVYAIWAMTLR